MDITTDNKNPNPRDGANPFSIIFFTYTIGIFKRGFQKTLAIEDLYNPIKSDKSAHLGDRLEKKWLRHVEYTKTTNKKPSFLKVLFSTFWPEYLYLGSLLVFMEMFLRILQPIVLGKFLDYFRPNTTTSKSDALWYAAIIAILGAGIFVINNQYFMNAFHYGMKLRAACCSLLYRKSLKLSQTALGDTASGQIVNLLSNDVSRFDVVSILLHHLWVGPISALITLYFLYQEAGYASLAGIIPILFILPFQSYTGKLSAIYRRQTAMKTDERVRMMDEIISGIQVIKMYAWEKPFTKLIRLARISELKVVMKSSYVRAIYMTFNLFTTRASLFCTLLTMALTDQPITASKSFMFLAFINQISTTMTSYFVRGISEAAELFVAISRIENFLINEEFIENDKIQAKPSHAEDAVSLQEITAKWNPASTENTLLDINLTVPKGQLLGVVGPVGSGKSSLLQTILGEVTVTSGSLDIYGKVSYSSQEPWIFNSTIRQNIVFGQEYDKKRYGEVIKVCSLEKDFDNFPDGDLTIVGDKGASLSGGQKTRVNLARAVYREADIYLLDDPLSAVDVHVGKAIYNDCIINYLKNKTRILVTHQVYHLKNADKIVIMEKGTIQDTGTFHSLSNSTNEYAKLLVSETEPQEEEKPKIVEYPKPRRMSIRSLSSSVASLVSDISASDNYLVDDEEEEREAVIEFKKLQEDSSKGKVKGSLFWKYLLSSENVCFVIMVISLFLITQSIASGVDYFVSYWTNVEEFRYKTIQRNESDIIRIETNNILSKNTYLYIYGGIVLALFAIGLTRSILFYNTAKLCSQKLHDKLFDNTVNFPMRFFDTNPSGRILNRFAKDIGTIDEILPKIILDSTQLILIVLGSLILISTTNPYFLIIIAVNGCIFMLLRTVYLRSSKNIKRLEAMMRGPVFTHLGATLQGLTTVRAFAAQEILRHEFDKHQDLHTSAYFMYIASSSAFGFYLDLLSFIFTTLVTFSFLLLSEYFGFTGGEVGLAITQAISLTFSLQWGVRQSAEVENQMMSVERVLEYNTMPREQQPINPKTPPDNWPSKGIIAFNNLCLKYENDMPLVLKNLNLTVKSNEKIGIVGRTGAGKSSLISALFKLAKIEGDIEIDDLNTKDLTLQLLRSKISIIPQDPILFSGTLRYNLDPFEEYPDNLLYKALNEVELKDPANIINRLEHRVMDRGTNYSVGQRQLICLARALVRNNKILMLDEATANVDPQTDAVIQTTIREKFANCTVLTIAHRLNTIMDSDKVLVMENGRAVEFDHPYHLLQNTESRFYKMVMESGKVMFDNLKQIAKQNFTRKMSIPE